MPDNVKCSECGLLALRHVKTRELREVEKETRKDGLIPEEGQFQRVPLCFAMKRVFTSREIKSDEHRRDVIAKDIECESFRQWTQGFTPKEHVEMKLLEEQRAWQKEREEADKRWREEQERNAEIRHKESMKVLVRAAIAGAIVGAIGGAILTATGALLAKFL